MPYTKADYIRLCPTLPQLPLFAQPWWLDIVCGNNWDVAITADEKSNQITGVFTYPIERKMGVSMIRLPQFTPYTGLAVIYPAAYPDHKKDNFQHKILTDLLAQVPQCQYWNLAFPPIVQQAGIFHHIGLSLSVRQTFLIDVRQSELQIFQNFRETTRNQIRNAEKELIITQTNNDLNTLVNLHLSNINERGIKQKIDLNLLQRLHAAGLSHECSSIWSVYDKDMLLGMVWEVWDKEYAYLFLCEKNKAITNIKAMPLLIWHCIKRAKARGNIYFDFEGSMERGIEYFFRNFAGKQMLYLVAKKNTSLLWMLKEWVQG